MTPPIQPAAPKKSSRAQVFEILGPSRFSLVLITVTIIFGASLELVPPLVMKQVVDAHLTPRIAEGLWWLAALYFGSIVLIQASNFLATYQTTRTAQAALHTLRVRLFTHLQHLPIHYFDQNPLGDIISRCTADVDAVDQLFSSGVMGLVTDLVRLVTLLIAMFVLSPTLTLVLILVVPPLVWVTNTFRKRIRDAERESRLAVGVLNAHLQETLGGVEVIRAFGREQAFVARFRGLLKRALKASNQSARYSALYSPILQILLAVVISLLLWSGAQSMFTAVHVTLGTLTAFVLLFKRFFDPITAVGEEWQIVQSALSGAERIFQVLDVPAEEQPQPAVGVFHKPTGGIELRQVSFGYYPKQPVLDQISFSIAAGEHVALVGRTGSGKSSILNLVGGLYTPWEGTVRVAGLDPRQLTEQDRRKVLGVVPQTVQLFSGTILDNLTLGDAEIPLEAVELAARLTGADTFIRTLPNSYETRINNGSGKGARLSSGQCQLLSLARALVWDPAVLLFDEATSAIDSASEAAFRQALQAEVNRRQRAILTVAHRLSTALEADRVIVLDHGRILEMNSPAELIRRGGRFAALLDMEGAGWDWRNNTLAGRAQTVGSFPAARV
jgi:ATP-binding cassette subfamily B protein